MARLPPVQSIIELGLHASEPGFVQFLLDARDDGFDVNQPGDDDLSDEEWNEISAMRVRVLVSAWKHYKEKLGDG